MGWLILGGSFAVFLILLYLDGRRRERAVARDWELALTPKGERALQQMESRVRNELALSDLTYRQAFQARGRGDYAEALRLVDVGCGLVEKFAPTMIKALAAMAVLSRMAAAIAPIRPLRPRDFRLAQLAHLAQLNRFFHHLLVTTAERFRFRVYVLQRAFRTIAGLVFRWTHRSGPAPGPQWDHLRAANEDMGTLTDESIETFKVLLVSLAAEKRA